MQKHRPQHLTLRAKMQVYVEVLSRFFALCQQNKT